MSFIASSCNTNGFHLFFRRILDSGFHKRKLAPEDDYAHEIHQREKETRPGRKENARFPDYGDDYDDYARRRRRRLFSVVTDAANSTLQRTDGTGPEWQKKDRKVTQNVSQPQPESQRPVKSAKHLPNLQQNRSGLKIEGQFKRREPLKQKRRAGQTKRAKVRSAEPVRAAGNEQRHAGEPEEQLGPKRSQKTMEPSLKPLKLEREVQQEEEEHISASKRGHPGESFIQTHTDGGKRLREREIEMNMPLQQDVEDDIHAPTMKAKEKDENKWSEPKDEELPAWTEEEEDNRDRNERRNREWHRDSVWEPGDDLEGTEEEDPTPPPVFDTDVNWSQTFQVNHLDLQAHRSDWIDLRCNISGNLLLKTTDALPIVKAFVEKLNEKHQW